jgi:hypothetical protein
MPDEESVPWPPPKRKTFWVAWALGMFGIAACVFAAILLLMLLAHFFGQHAAPTALCLAILALVGYVAAPTIERWLGLKQ